ncbi:hypothetical protein MKX03_006192 [Papaver bracteatum]|nr:hypothetical protein MKX03_006192 [Papaver bracteatum]
MSFLQLLCLLCLILLLSQVSHGRPIVEQGLGRDEDKPRPIPLFSRRPQKITPRP